MENWDYYISGIWKSGKGDDECISDVFLHSAAGGFGKGTKTSKDDIVDLLKHGAKITTITWNYHLVQWRFGAKVEYCGEGEGARLRTQTGAAIFDDLESSIQMQYIMAEESAVSLINKSSAC